MDKISYEIGMKDNGSPVLKNFSKNVDKASQSVGMMGKAGTLANTSFKAMAGAMAGVAVLSFAKNTLEALDAQQKFANSIGASAKNIVGLNYAAELGGSSIEGMEAGLKKLAINMSNAFQKGDLKKFEQLGISVKNSAGELRSADDVMVELADNFASMQDGTAKATLAYELFGKKGIELIPILNQGSEALRNQVNEGVALKGANESLVGSMERFNDSLTQVQAAGQGIVSFIVSTLEPVIERFSTGIGQWARDLAERAQVAQSIADSEKQGRDQEIKDAYRNKAVYDEMLVLKGKLSDKELDIRSKLAGQISDYEKIGKLTGEQIRMNKIQGTLAAMSAIEAKNGNKQDIFDEERKLELNQELLGIKKKIEDSKPKKTSGMENFEPKEIKPKEEMVKEVDWEDIKAKKLEELSAKVDNAYELEQNRIKENADLDNWFFENRKALKEQSLEDERMVTESIKNDEIKAKKELLDLEKVQHDERMRLIEEETQARIEGFQSISTFASQIGNTISKVNQVRIRGIENRFDLERSRAEESAQAEITLANGNQSKIDQINEALATKKTQLVEEQQAEELAVKRKTFEIEKTLSMVEATMNGAVAITQALASAPPPLNFALAAGVGVATAAEIALIQSQKLAAGGSPVGKNAIVMMNEQGAGTERILNASGTKTAGNEFVSSLNAGKSMQEALNASGASKSSGQVINVNVAGFVDSPRTVEYIANAVSKAVRKRR